MGKFLHHKPDRLVSVRKDGVVLGKRIGAKCPIDKEEAREYVLHGPLDAVKMIRARRNVGLGEAYDLLNTARYGKW